MNYLSFLIIFFTLAIILYLYFKNQNEIKKIKYEHHNEEIEDLNNEINKIKHSLQKITQDNKVLSEEISLYQNDQQIFKEKYNKMKDEYVLEQDILNRKKIAGIKQMELENSIQEFMNKSMQEVLLTKNITNKFLQKMKRLIDIEKNTVN